MLGYYMLCINVYKTWRRISKSRQRQNHKHKDRDSWLTQIWQHFLPNGNITVLFSKKNVLMIHNSCTGKYTDCKYIT